MSLLATIDDRLRAAEHNVEVLKRMRDLALQMDDERPVGSIPPASDEAEEPEPDPLENRRREPPPPAGADEPGTLDGRIIEFLTLKHCGAKALARALEADPQLVQQRLMLLLNEGEIERGRGGVYRRVV